MNKEQFEKITKWAREIFPVQSIKPQLNKVQEELDELKQVIINGSDDSVRKEMADVFITSFILASRMGMSYDNIVKAIDDKMEVNYKREWTTDIAGLSKHK